MYSLLAGKSEYIRKYNRRYNSLNSDMLALFQSDAAAQTLKAAKIKADSYAKQHKFRDYQTKKIERSYQRALSDLKWVKETNGELVFKQTFIGNLLDRLFFILMFGVIILVIRDVTARF